MLRLTSDVDAQNNCRSSAFAGQPKVLRLKMGSQAVNSAALANLLYLLLLLSEILPAREHLELSIIAGVNKTSHRYGSNWKRFLSEQISLT